MIRDDLTIIIAVDRNHIPQARHAWPNWLYHKPQLRDLPLVVIYDKSEISLQDLPIFESNKQVKFVPWDMPGISQREKMLTAFVKVPGQVVKTNWYVKIDIDVAATDDSPWFFDEWFNPDEHGRVPVYVSNPWGYTKPPDALDILDDWGDTIPQISKFPRLNIHREPGSNIVKSKRIASWIFFGLTKWTAQMASLCGDRLPIPSQDTFLYYCAARMGYRTLRRKMRHHGWALLGRRELRRIARG
jgi:hypothetical protein